MVIRRLGDRRCQMLPPGLNEIHPCVDRPAGGRSASKGIRSTFDLGHGAYELAPAGDARQRLAVLTFTHLGEAAAPESFASGLTEELVTQLGRICSDRLGVIARSSSMRVQRIDRTAREIGSALRAQYLLEGTVRREANRVRITAQLIEAQGETQLWAESYDRPPSDSLLVQTD